MCKCTPIIRTPFCGRGDFRTAIIAALAAAVRPESEAEQ